MHQPPEGPDLVDYERGYTEGQSDFLTIGVSRHLDRRLSWWFMHGYWQGWEAAMHRTQAPPAQAPPAQAPPAKTPL